MSERPTLNTIFCFEGVRFRPRAHSWQQMEENHEPPVLRLCRSPWKDTLDLKRSLLCVCIRSDVSGRKTRPYFSDCANPGGGHPTKGVNQS